MTMRLSSLPALDLACSTGRLMPSWATISRQPDSAPRIAFADAEDRAVHQIVET